MPQPSPSRTTLVLAAALLLAAPPAAAQSGYVQTNLVSDIPGLAKTTDPLLVNPWGVSFSPTSPFWVSNAGTGTSTLYTGGGSTKVALTVTIPGPGGEVPGVPTGQAFNNTGAFRLPTNNTPATFLFASVTGTLAGWNGAAGTTAVTLVNGAAGGAAYTGLAVSGSGATARLYAANFGNGRVDVFDGNLAPIAGGFVDPTIPAGYAPFNVHNVGGQIFVTYALRDPITGRDVPGAGNGFVDVFDANGTLVRRLTGGGPLNSPWGVALAPATFGTFGGSLLVGNFGNGTIGAFDPLTGAFRGLLGDPTGATIVNEGLWEITFGNGTSGDANTLYFAAGIQGETHGLFGSLAVVPEPGTVGLVATGLGVLLAGAARRRRGVRAG